MKPYDLKEAKGWIEEIKAAQSAKTMFNQRAELAIQDFEAFQNATKTGELNGCHYPIHWANIRTIRPNLFFRKPTPRVVRQNKFRTDPEHILASQIIEKNIERSIEEQPFEERIKYGITQALNVALAQVWLRYHFERDEDGEGANDVSREFAEVQIVHYEDYLCNPARHADEVIWMGRAFYVTRDDFEKAYPDCEIKKVTFSSSSKGDKGKTTDELSNFARAKIWEIWDSQSRKVYFIADGYEDKILKTITPAIPSKGQKKLLFKGFFPCPRPLVLGTQSNDSVWPICDHHYYKVQAEMLNSGQAKSKDIANEGIKVSGIYDKSAHAAVQNMLMNKNGTYSPHEFNENNIGGGWDSLVKMFPAGTYAEILQTLDGISEVQLKRIYELTGMSDILRGQGDPEETLGAQEIKYQSASMRLDEMRLEVQRFVGDIYALIAEIAAEVYHWSTLLQNAGIDMTGLVESGDPLYPMVDPQLLKQVEEEKRIAQSQYQQQVAQAQQAQQQGQQAEQPQQPQPGPAEQQLFKTQQVERVIKLVRDERTRYFSIQVDVDAMLKRDEDKDKQASIEFTQALTETLRNFTDMAKVIPAILPVVPKLIMLVVRKYDKGREFEQEIESALNQFVEQSMQPPAPPPPDPYIEIEKLKLQLQAQKAQGDTQLKGQELSVKATFEQRDAAREDYLAQLKGKELELKGGELGIKGQTLQLKAQESTTLTDIESAKMLQSMQDKEAENELETANTLIKAEELAHTKYKDEKELETTGVMR